MKFLFRKSDPKSDHNEIEILMSKNFGLSSVEFDHLLNKLKQGDEQLFEDIFLAQFKDSMNFLIRSYQVDYEVSYDIVMDTIILFRSKMLDGKISYGNLQFLFNTMVKQLYLKSLQKKSHAALLEFDIVEDNENAFNEDNFQSLEKAWIYLNDKEKLILEKFYYLKIPLNIIALEQNINEASLRKQKQRALEKLKYHFQATSTI